MLQKKKKTVKYLKLNLHLIKIHIDFTLFYKILRNSF